jgi:hypothetical protein
LLDTITSQLDAAGIPVGLVTKSRYLYADTETVVDGTNQISYPRIINTSVTMPADATTPQLAVPQPTQLTAGNPSQSANESQPNQQANTPPPDFHHAQQSIEEEFLPPPAYTRNVPNVSLNLPWLSGEQCAACHPRNPPKIDLDKIRDELNSAECKYITNALGQIFIGEWSGAKPNALGVVGSVAFGFTGLDAYKDIGDISHDLYYWEWSYSHAAGFGTNCIGVLPVVGSFKNLKNIPDLAKSADDLVEAGAAVAKAAKVAPTKAVAVDDLVISSYGTLSRRTDLTGQAHHLNQTAAYRDVIPSSQGVSIRLQGNILTDAGTPHTRAHQSLEEFWNKYRGSDIVPTNLEYSRALQQSLRSAGLLESQVRQAVRAAIRQRIDYGLLGGIPVPRVPGPIRNLAK